MTTSATSATSATSPAADATAKPTASSNALASLANNFNDFLSLLTTQLKNQNPTSPLDTNQFTTELVQFTGVEQQINTNASLTALIQATQGAEVIQATGVVGKPVVVSADHLALQDGAGSINFTAPTAEPVSVAVYTDRGVKLAEEALQSVAGKNVWTWDGATSGGQAPDGAYKVVVTGTGAGGNTSALPFTVNGIASGVTNTDGAVKLNVGGLSVDFSKVQSVGQ